LRLQLVSPKQNRSMKYTFALIAAILSTFIVGFSQSNQKDTAKVYKKRVLEATEIDFLSSFYTQDGDNAAVGGGIGTEELTDVTATFIIYIPVNDDDILSIDAGISAYTSASSSNIDPFDGELGDPFVASSGASRADVWANITGAYSHSSYDRNNVWSAYISISDEYDYSSFGFGASYTRRLNRKNTELNANASILADNWRPIYPIELRPFLSGGAGLNDHFFARNTITGNPVYQPKFSDLAASVRNTYTFGISLSQILHKNVQGSLAVDFVQQQGLLSTPFQRVYFADVEASFIDNFQLADDIERLPDKRVKIAIGSRLHWYLNERISTRMFYRFFWDDWGIISNTASIELPIKIADRFTIYPSYRFYNQSAIDYFAPANQHLSDSKFYTSDYDLSEYTANQFGFGVSYTDIFATAHLGKFGIKSIDLKFYQYSRNTSFGSSIITGGIRLVKDQ
jgi:hypothetical protein